MTGGYWVYLYSDRSGNPVYGGYTSNLRSRIRFHRSQSPWWNPTLRLTSINYQAELEALTAEAELIRVLSPQHNKRRRSGRASHIESRPAKAARELEQLYPLEDVADLLTCSTDDVPAYLCHWRIRYLDIGDEVSGPMPRVRGSDLPALRAHIFLMQPPALALT